MRSHFCLYTEVADMKEAKAPSMIAAEITPCQGNAVDLGNLQDLGQIKKVRAEDIPVNQKTRLENATTQAVS